MKVYADIAILYHKAVNHCTCTSWVEVRKEAAMRQRSSASWRSWKVSDGLGVQVDGIAIFFSSWIPCRTAGLCCSRGHEDRCRHVLPWPAPGGTPTHTLCPLIQELHWSLGLAVSYVTVECAPSQVPDCLNCCLHLQDSPQTWLVTLPLSVTTLPCSPSSRTVLCWWRHCLHCGRPQLPALLRFRSSSAPAFTPPHLEQPLLPSSLNHSAGVGQGAVVLTGRPLYTEEFKIHKTVNLNRPRSVLCCTYRLAFRLVPCCTYPLAAGQPWSARCNRSHLVLATTPPPCPCPYLTVQQEGLLWASFLFGSRHDDWSCFLVRKSHNSLG